MVGPEEEVIEPGGETIVHIQVNDFTKKPLQNAEVVLLVVDESVLALR